MRTRDPETKKQLLFEAALAEFAEFGMSGARIDRLARRAGISPGLVYSFHEGKAQLFDAVFDRIVELTVSAVPIDADHLPEYAVGLHDAGAARPDVVRFLAWYRLERGDAAAREAVMQAMAEKVAAIEAAQRRGTVTDALPAAQLLVAVIALANMWHQPGEDFDALVPVADRREAIAAAVRRLVAP